MIFFAWAAVKALDNLEILKCLQFFLVLQGIVIGFISVFSEIYTTKKHIEAPSDMCDFEVKLSCLRNWNIQDFYIFH